MSFSPQNINHTFLVQLLESLLILCPPSMCVNKTESFPATPFPCNKTTYKRHKLGLYMAVQIFTVWPNDAKLCITVVWFCKWIQMFKFSAVFLQFWEYILTPQPNNQVNSFSLSAYLLFPQSQTGSQSIIIVFFFSLAGDTFTQATKTWAREEERGH